MFFSSHDEWDAPTLLSQLWHSPLKLLLRIIYTILLSFRSPAPTGNPAITIVCLSDTHTQTATVPPGDILIHAGDLTNAGTTEELQAAIDWLASLPHKHKITIAGNHDTYLDPRSRSTLSAEDQKRELDWKDITYLQHSSKTLTFPSSASSPSSDQQARTLTIYGAPQLPQCGGPEFAFQYPPDQDAWSETVPADIDVLVTHTPPQSHFDIYGRPGCPFLLKELWRVRPKLHVFGHIHAMPGTEFMCWDHVQGLFEEGMRRRDGGLLRKVLDFGLWFLLLRMVYWGLAEILWDLGWGGRQERTVLVNAAVMSQETKRVERGALVLKL